MKGRFVVVVCYFGEEERRKKRDDFCSACSFSFFVCFGSLLGAFVSLFFRIHIFSEIKYIYFHYYKERHIDANTTKYKFFIGCTTTCPSSSSVNNDDGNLRLS